MSERKKQRHRLALQASKIAKVAGNKGFACSAPCAVVPGQKPDHKPDKGAPINAVKRTKAKRREA
jgi:hypothetical protein